MLKKYHFAKPTARQSATLFKKTCKCSPPPAHKTYNCDAFSPVNAVAEFAPMGEVLVAYPGTLAPPEDKK